MKLDRKNKVYMIHLTGEAEGTHGEASFAPSKPVSSESQITIRRV
jgi:hypothetical protein